ncbi:hypothetical protein GYMLUDRAFT_262276 [Collybiopsis luxurians FD-317 M1]|uniref:Uncharacterized protein n=1 Tax=Collybiopsis luxurians FD-317 M1 TaxID=944289 RepID=A0A0D0BU13_9AGAR|nr:hypothetical protein GYMLUDRAFT_262276 [Collybiopsis luxurians FD-317 M1]
MGQVISSVVNPQPSSYELSLLDRIVLLSNEIEKTPSTDSERVGILLCHRGETLRKLGFEYLRKAQRDIVDGSVLDSDLEYTEACEEIFAQTLEVLRELDCVCREIPLPPEPESLEHGPKPGTLIMVREIEWLELLRMIVFGFTHLHTIFLRLAVTIALLGQILASDVIILSMFVFEPFVL